MKKQITSIISGLVLITAFLFISNQKCAAQDTPPNYEKNWAQWRGPLGTGSAIIGNPPTEFNETKNLKWKTEIPGGGHATPIVWENHIILLTAVPTDKKMAGEPKTEEPERRGPPSKKTEFVQQFTVISVDKNTGKINWQRIVKEEVPEESTHNLGNWAANSPCTDGELIYAYFGSRGIFCLDFEGNVLWEKDFGQMEKRMSFGEGSSPYLYKDKLFIQWDHEGQSFMVALNKKTGEEAWKLDRDEITSWSTPFVTEINGQTQVITNATNKIRSYDYETGEIIWESTGMTANVIPPPVLEDGMLFLMSGFRGNALQAVDLKKAKGDITQTDAIVWKYDKNTSYTPAPLLMGGKLYFLRTNNGNLTCLDAKTGKEFYALQKLEGISTLYSSPTGAADKIYIASKETVVVVKAGEEFQILATNKLDDDFEASPVVVGNDLFLRGFKSLYCFTEK